MTKSTSDHNPHLLRSTVHCFVTAGTLAVALFTTGCSTIENMHLEQQARAQAELRWSFLMRGDFQSAWNLHSEGWRAANPYLVWKAQFGTDIAWEAAETAGSVCNGAPADVCTVSVRVRYLVKNLPIKDTALTSEIKETWINSAEGWRHVPGTVKAE